MKSLMTIAAAALCCAAFAEGPEGGAMREGARRGGFGRGMMGGGMSDPIVRMVSNPRVAEKLSLGEDQKAKLKEIVKPGPEARERQKKVREATMRQVELMKADKIDEAAVMKAIDEVFELRKEMAKDQARRAIAVKSILTPEQIAKAHEEMKKMRPERGPVRNGRGEMHGQKRGGFRGKGARGGASAPEGDAPGGGAPKAE